MSEPRYRRYGEQDDPPLLDGDTFFRGVVESLDPDKLPEGIVASATNVRFNNGRAEPRPGIIILPWMKGTGTTAYSTTSYPICGAGLFSEPDGAEWLVVAAEGAVYAAQAGNVAVSVPLPAGVTITGEVEFVQTFDRLVMLRGYDLAPLVLDTIGEGFKEITEAESESGNGTGTLPIPNASYGDVFQNRLLLVGDGDLGYVSDIGNMTRYLIGRAFRINEGSNDRLRRLFPFGDDTILAFKGESVYPITGLTPDTAGDWSGAVMGDVTRTHGLAAAGAVVQAGKDVYYLSTHGLTSLRLTEQNKLQAVDVPLSAKLNLTWRRINWSAISAARLAYWTDGESTSRLYLALPLDAARLDSPTELCDATQTYSDTVAYTLSGLTAGARYYYEQGPSGYKLVNGTETLYGASVFTAQGTSVDLYARSSSNPNVDDSVKRVLAENCNTAVAVYDFNTGEWSGTDEAGEKTSVKRWVTMTFNGQNRLIAVGNDGIVRLYEEGFEDEEFQTVTPYLDVTVVAKPAVGQTLQINAGTTISAVNQDENQVGGAANWGANTPGGSYSGSPTLAGTNLWASANGNGGFKSTATGPWTAANTTKTQIADGVRFVATNGTVPTAKVNGVSQTASGLYGASSWCYLEFHSGTEIVSVPVLSSLTTRGYTCPDNEFRATRLARKRFLRASLNMDTWNPSITVAALVDGLGEDASLLASQTRDRTKYLTFNTADYDTTNVNGDWSEPYREDYSVSPSERFNFDASDDVNVDAHQTYDWPLRPGVRGRYLQLRVAGARGRCVLRSTTTAGQLIDRAQVIKV